MFRQANLAFSFALFVVVTMVLPAPVCGRGFGGFHGGGGGGLADRGISAGGLGGGGLAAGGLGGGRLEGGGLGALGNELGGLAAGPRGGSGRLGDLGLGGAGLNGLGEGGASDLASRVRGAANLDGAGLGAGQRALGNLSGIGSGGAPTRGELSNFLGLPSDNGLHELSSGARSRLSQSIDQAKAGNGPRQNALSGETQSRLSQLYDNVKAGDGPLRNYIPGETQSRLSQLYDNVRTGNGPLKNYIPGETQSKLSQLYDQMRAGNGPFHNFIPGETQKPLSRLYDQIRAGNRPFHPMSPWIIHNNAVVIRRNFNNYYIFTPGWYRRYPAAWYPAAWVYGNAWIYAPWPTLSVWLGCPTSQPVYYDYGNNVVNQNNSIYVNGQDVGTSAQYYQQAQSLAQSGAGADAASDQQWMPLGVFAISESGQTSANLILQLAVDKQGIIRGNLTNTKSNTNELVHGAVNKQTERAAWTIGNDTTTVFETGVYNLTKAQTPVIIHFGNDQTEQALLVRLDQKDQSQDQALNSQQNAAP